MNMNLQPVSVLLFEPDAVQRSKLHTWLQQHDQHVRVHIHECHELPTFTAADNATVSPYEMLVFRLSSVDLTKTLESLKDEYGIPLLPVVVLVDQPGKYGEIVINNCLIEVPIFARRGQAQQREVLQTVAPLAHEYFSGIHSRLVTVEPDLVIPYALARHGEFQRMRKLLPELFLYHCGYESSKQQPIALNGNPTILWLENNNAVKMRLKSYLEQYGYRVLPVCNEEELVAWCQRITPSLILISVDADRKTGTKEQVQRIRSLVATERVPIIVMNSVAFTETNGPDQKTGGAGYHRRPFSLQALLNKIEQYAPCKHNEQQTERATA